MTENKMPKFIKLWTIYDKPKDFPDMFVARLFHNDKPTDQAITCGSIEPLRKTLEQSGFVCIGRQLQDEPYIVEVWI